MRLIVFAIVMSILTVAVAVVLAQRAPAAVSQADIASIVVDDARFTPNRLDATVGQILTVNVTNVGTQPHDLSFQSLHMPGLGGAE